MRHFILPTDAKRKQDHHYPAKTSHPDEVQEDRDPTASFKLEKQHMVFCFFEDLAEMRSFVKETWLQYEDGSLDLQSAAFVTNAAVSMVERTENELIDACRIDSGSFTQVNLLRCLLPNQSFPTETSRKAPSEALSERDEARDAQFLTTSAIEFGSVGTLQMLLTVMGPIILLEETFNGDSIWKGVSLPIIS